MPRAKLAARVGLALATLTAVVANVDATRADSPRAEPPPSESARGSHARPDEAPLPEPVRVAVPGDKAVLVVPGQGSLVVAYLHGRCGDPTAFRAWASAARSMGTVISLRGDSLCKDGQRTRWTEDVAWIDRRIGEAIAATRKQLGLPLDPSRRVLFGYSQGALRTEAIAARFPERYPWVVLAAGPRGPRPGSLRKARGVLVLGGELDVRRHLVAAANELEKARIRARYVELPGARHGEYGPEAERTLHDGLAWLLARTGSGGP